MRSKPSKRRGQRERRQFKKSRKEKSNSQIRVSWPNFTSPQCDFSTLEKCSDLRLLLTIMERAPCFNDEESDLAGKLKRSGNETAHNQADRFTKNYTMHV